MSTESCLVSFEEWLLTNMDLCYMEDESLEFSSNALFPVSSKRCVEREFWPPSTSPPPQQLNLYPLSFDESLLVGAGAWNQSPGWSLEPWPPVHCIPPPNGSYAESLNVSPGLDESFDGNVPYSQDVDAVCPIDHSPRYPVSLSKSPASSPESRSLGGRRCDWPECSTGEPFKTVEESKLHIKSHACNVREKWKVGDKCTWHGCSSRALHKTVVLFDKHLNNIHVNPLICTVRNCYHKTPFRANAELQRHIISVHSEKQRFKCPYQSCGLHGRVFSRRDKLISHIRGCHDTHACPYSNCLVWMENSRKACESTAKHIAKMHGNFECALNSCEGSASQFLESSLLDHLQIRHEMDWEQALKARDAAKEARGRILRDEHILRNMNT